jgi:sarcosine oxidase
MNSHYDIIVIGVGAMGSATLYSLAKRGYKVCGIEQFGVAHNQGSSHGETRLIRKAYFEHPNYLSLLHSAYDEWEQLNEESGQELFAKNGLLLAGKPDSTIIKGLKACYSQHDLPHEKLDIEEAQKRWPDINLPEGSEVYYDPIAGYLHVEKCIREFCRLAAKEGAKLFNHEKVIKWQTNTNSAVTVTTEKRTISSDRLIITCGAWASGVLKSLDLNLEIWRKVLFWYDAPDLEPFRPGRFPSFFIETDKGGFYGFPAINSAGIKIGEHYGKQIVSNPDKLNQSVDEEENEPVSNFVSRTFPGLRTSPNKSVVCMYTMSPDENFIIDHHPEYETVVFAAGFSGHGFKFAPVIGNILADLAIDGSTEYPIDFLRLKRFA